MRKIITLLSAVFISTTALAEGNNAITLREKAACAPDAIRYCIHLDKQKHEPGIVNHVIACLQQHRDKLRKSCAAAFEKRGM